MRNLPLSALAASSIFALAACAGSESSPMTTGERISQRGSQINQYGDAWSSGQADVTEGERSISRSDRSIERAQSQIADAREALANAEDRLRAAQQDREVAEQLVANGTVEMRQAEQDYAAVRAGPSADPANPNDTPEN